VVRRGRIQIQESFDAWIIKNNLEDISLAWEKTRNFIKAYSFES
jgi:hypothetical protein